MIIIIVETDVGNETTQITNLQTKKKFINR